MGNLYIGGSGSGSGTYQIQTVTATASVNSATVSGWNYMVIVDCTSNNMILTMPSSALASYKGQNINIKRIDSSNNTCVIVPSISTESIEGIVNNKIYLYGQNDSITLTSLGTGDSKISSDNRNSTGSTTSFMRVTKPVGQSTNLTANSSIIFDTTEIIQGNGITYNSSTGAITLLPNRTYKLKAGFSKINLSGVGYFYMQWYNDTTSLFVGEQCGGDDVTATSHTMQSDICTYSITPNVTTTLRCVIVGLSSVTSIVYPWAEIEEISRQATIISSVDYISAYQSTTQTLTTSNTNTILTIDTKTAGNLTLSSNTVTLTAGKTYKLDGGVGYGGSAFDIAFYNVTTSTYLSSNSSYVQSTTNGSISVHYTPTANCQVALAVRSVTSAGTEGYTSGSRILNAWMTITQVGSTACTGIPQNLITGTEWVSYTPTFGATITAPTLPTAKTLRASYSVIGKTLKLNFFYSQTATSSNGGNGCYLINLPNSYTINTSLTGIESSPVTTNPTNPITGSQVGRGRIHGYSSAQYSGNITVIPYSATQLLMFTDHADGAYFSSSLFTLGGFSTLTVSFQAEIPLA